MGWRLAGVLGFTGVALGAFGAHGLKDIVTDPHLMDVWKTGAHYHLIHAVMVAVAALHPARPVWPARLFTAGILLFSGSLYLMAVTGTLWLGAITPLGGLCFLAGWASLGLAKVPPA